VSGSVARASGAQLSTRAVSVYANVERVPDETVAAHATRDAVGETSMCAWSRTYVVPAASASRQPASWPVKMEEGV
jgi:hypothetical protein